MVLDMWRHSDFGVCERAAFTARLFRPCDAYHTYSTYIQQRTL